MSNHPNKGVELVTELYKAPILPPYRLQLIQEIRGRIKDSLRRSFDLKTNHSATGDQNKLMARLLIERTLTERWKRYLAVYFYERWRRIRNLHWAYGRGVPDQVKQNFAPQEKNALDEYEKLIQAYIRNSGVEVTTSLTPPVVVFVEIDVLENIGTIQNESGSHVFMRGSRHLVRRRDVEHLIQVGLVVEVASSALHD